MDDRDRLDKYLDRRVSSVRAESSALSTDATAQESRRILRNVVLVSASFMVLFTAYGSMANLQSSINSVDGLGTWSLTATYAALVVSCLLLPAPAMAKFGVKWTMAGAMLCYSTYIAAQFYPEFYTLIPAAIILGLGGAPMWSAQCTYLTRLGYRVASLTNVPAPLVINRFFGVFFLFFQLSAVWGNLISATVLNDGDDSDISSSDMASCGPSFCPSDASDGNDNFDVEDSKIYTLATVYLVFSLLSVVAVAFLLDPLSRFGVAEEGGKGGNHQWLQLASATFSHMRKHEYQQLLIPLTMWSGVEQGFFSSDFTASYITCPYGVENIGYVLVTYGAVDAIFSFVWGYVIREIGRPAVFFLGAASNVAAVAVLFCWQPEPGEEWVLYAVAALWAVGDAVWQTQINSLYGVLFADCEEAAFSNYRLWESVGFIFAFILQNSVCVSAKLWCVVGTLAAGLSGYVAVEALEWRRAGREEGQEGEGGRNKKV